MNVYGVYETPVIVGRLPLYVPEYNSAWFWLVYFDYLRAQSLSRSTTKLQTSGKRLSQAKALRHALTWNTRMFSRMRSTVWLCLKFINMNKQLVYGLEHASTRHHRHDQEMTQPRRGSLTAKAFHFIPRGGRSST